MPNGPTEAQPARLAGQQQGQVNGHALGLQTETQPYVDKQETFDHSKTSERTANGHRDAEMTEKKSQSTEQTVSRSPEVTKVRTVEEQTQQSISKSSETSAKGLPPVALSVECAFPQPSVALMEVRQPAPMQQLRTELSEQKMFQTMSESSETSGPRSAQAPALAVFTPEVNGEGSCRQGMQSQLKEQEYIHEKSDHRVSDQPLPKSHDFSAILPTLPPLAEAFEAFPKSMRQGQPYADRQETFSQSKTSQKTEHGHRESETAEKKSQIFEQSATPTMTSSKTVEETSFQTTSHETSNERAPELSGSLPFSRPEVHPQVTFQRPSFTQARTEATERSSLGSKSNTFSVGALAPLTNLQPPSQPQVDKQETFSYSKTSEATDKGLRESEVTEKKGQTFEKSISETPGMTEVKTVEEQSSQLISKSSETSQDSVLERKPMIRPSSRIQTPGDQLDQLTPLLKMETNNTNQQSKEEKHIQTTSKLDAFTKSLLEGPPTLVAPQAPFSHADVPQTFSNYQPQEQPYVDRQETFSKSKTSEKTEQGLKESETTEKKSQTFQQSATPTMTSSKTVEEQCIQKTSIETSGEKLPHAATPVPQLSAQPEAKPHSISSRATMPQVNTETTQQMSLETTSERHEASKYAAPPNLNETLVPPVPLATSEVPQQRSEVPDRPHSLERSVLETDSELKTFRTLPPRVGPKPFSSNLAYPVGTPAPFKRVQPSFQPCVDKESQHKMAEKTSIVIDKHNITESQARPFKPTVPRPSKMTEPKTVKEQTYQSSSKTSETSQQKYPEEYPVTPDMTPAYDFVQPAPVPQSTTETRQQQMSQSRTQSLERTNLGPAQVPVPEAVHPATIAGRDYQQHERAESKEQKSVSEVSKHLLVEKRQPEFFSRRSVSPARFAHVEAPRTLPKHEPPAQPCVEKQKDSRQCETTQQTVYDRKLLEVTGEADQTSGQPAVSTMASSKTVEEMLSKSHGFSKDRLPQPPFSVPYPFSQPETQPYETIEFSPLPQAKTLNTEQMSTSSTSESSVLSRQASPQVPEAMPPRVAAKPLSSGPAHPVGIPKLVADLHPSAQPYVDKQETFSHSKTSETTDKGCRQSEIAEKKGQAVEHFVSTTPGKTESRTVEEQTFQSISKSSETSQETVPEIMHLTSQFPQKAGPTKEPQKLTPLLPSETAGQKYGSKEESYMQTTSMLDNVNRKVSQVPVSSLDYPTRFADVPSPRPFVKSQPEAQPYMDKQETVSQSRTSEKTEHGSKESETAEKKSQTFERSVTPTMTTTKTVEEVSSQAMSHETSEEKVPRAPAPFSNVFSQPQVQPQDMCRRGTLPQTKTKTTSDTSQETISKSHETSLHSTPEVPNAKFVPSVHLTPAESPRQPGHVRDQTHSLEKSYLNSNSECRASQHSSPLRAAPEPFSLGPFCLVGSPKPLANLHHPGQPYVDKQETFSHCKTSEAIDKGRRDSEITEKKVQALEQFVSETPEITESKTVEEQTFQSLSKSLQTSQEGPSKIPPPTTYQVVQTGIPAMQAPKPAPVPPAKIKTSEHKSLMSMAESSDASTLAPGNLAQAAFFPERETLRKPQLQQQVASTADKSVHTSRRDIFERDAPQARAAPSPPRSRSMPAFPTHSSIQPQPQPHVDKQETFSKSKTSEKTEHGHRESETSEKRSQAVEQSATPTTTSTKIVKEESYETSTHTQEMTQEPVPPVTTSVVSPFTTDDASFQRVPQAQWSPLLESKKETMEQHYLQTQSQSQQPPQPLAAPVLYVEAPRDMPDRRTHSTEERLLETLSTSKISQDESPLRHTPVLSSGPIYPVKTSAQSPEHRAQGQPYVDKQETFSHSKTSERTEGGHREAEVTEKKRQAVEQSVSKTADMMESKTVEELSLETSSKSFETSQTKPSQETPSVMHPFVPTEAQLRQPAGDTPLMQSNMTSAEQKSFQAMSETSRTSPHSQERGASPQSFSSVGREVPRAQQQQHTESFEGTSRHTTSQQPVALKDWPRIEAAQLQPCVDKQETFSQSKTSETTEKGHRETETTEKNSQSFEQSVSQTPTATSTKAVEEKSFQTISHTIEQSGPEVIREPPRIQQPEVAAEGPIFAAPQSVQKTHPRTEEIKGLHSVVDRQAMAPVSPDVGLEDQIITGASLPSMPSLFSDHSQMSLSRKMVDQKASSSVGLPQEKIIPVRVTSETLKKETQEKQVTHSISSTMSETSPTTWMPMPDLPSWPSPPIGSQPISNHHSRTENQLQQSQQITSRAEQANAWPMASAPGQPSSFVSRQENATAEKSHFTRREDQLSHPAREHVIPVQLSPAGETQSSRHVQLSQQSQVERQVTESGREHVIPVQVSPFSERPLLTEQRVVSTNQSWSNKLERSSSMTMAHDQAANACLQPLTGAHSGQASTGSHFLSPCLTAAPTLPPLCAAGELWPQRPAGSDQQATFRQGGAGLLQAAGSDGDAQHQRSSSYSSGSEYEQVEVPTGLRRASKQAEEAAQAEKKVERSEREEVRPDGKYLVQRTVETTTEQEMKRSESSEVVQGTVPPIH